MDPQALWRDICDLVNTPGDNCYDKNPDLYGEFYDKMEDLGNWLQKGGFPPIVDLESDIGRTGDFHCYACGRSGDTFRIMSNESDVNPGYVFSVYSPLGTFKFETHLG